jgi:hypothetical protein
VLIIGYIMSFFGLELLDMARGEQGRLQPAGAGGAALRGQLVAGGSAR